MKSLALTPRCQAPSLYGNTLVPGTAAVLLFAVFLALPAGAEKRGPGPRTTYEKSAESTTGGSAGAAAECLAPGEAGNVQAVMAAYRRRAARAKELRNSFLEIDQQHDERLRHLARLDDEIRTASETERLIAQGQPKSGQLAQARAILSDLRKQKEELAAYDRAQEGERQRRLKELEREELCARKLVTLRNELRQGALEERRGTIEWRQKGRGSAWTAPEGEITLHPGDSIRTGADGQVTLRLPDGSRLVLGPSSGFTLSGDPGLLGEQTYGRILYQIQQYLRRMEVRTPAAVCGVRGTEFSLDAGPEQATRLTAVDGAVEFKAIPEKTDAARKAAWWAGKASVMLPRSLPEGALARVTDGSARMKTRGGSWEPAGAGALIKESDLIRAVDAPVSLALAGGMAAVLDAGAVLQAREDEKKQPLFGLWRGRLYVKRAPGATGPEPRFTSPTAVCAVRGTEFDMHVPAGEAPEFVIYDGRLEVTADQKRFQDPDRFRAWWED